jgi:hypothetical protein
MTREDVRFIVMTLVLVFLFLGEPDVFDKLRDYAMSTEVCK